MSYIYIKDDTYVQISLIWENYILDMHWGASEVNNYSYAKEWSLQQQHTKTKRAYRDDYGNGLSQSETTLQNHSMLKNNYNSYEDQLVCNMIIHDNL